MSTCLLNIFLLIIFTSVRASEAANKFNKEDLNGFAELVQKGNGNIGNLTPLTKSLNLPDLSLMAEALQPLEDKSRSKRQTENEGQLGDEVKESDDDPFKSTQLEIDANTKTIQMPLGKKGNPAFSINAKTVYILYPSLFQDPNIFGRFSIPQNINMDKNTLGTETTIPKALSAKPEVQMAQPQQPQQHGPTQYPPQQYPSRKGRRSADPPAAAAEAPKKAEEPKKRNVESHLSGTIVVQNQDVNEYNRRDSY